MTAKAPKLALAALLAASLAACATTPPPPKEAKAPDPLTPVQQYSIKVSQAPRQIALAIHAKGLSPNQQTALADFFGRWRDNGGGDVEVKAPVGVGDPALARNAADATLAFLRHLGVPAERLRLAGYKTQIPNAPVIASFEAFEALGPDCSQGWSNLVATKDNKPQTHFGCAETANIAAMIANPRDLVEPAAIDPADNTRREIVMGKYRQGANTSTTADSQASGTVSSQ